MTKFIERRQSVRKRTFLRGRIMFNSGASSMDCLIRDMSAMGARLELSESAVLPEVFDLHIQNKDAKYRSTLRWRHGSAMGVSFQNYTVKPPPEGAGAAYVPAPKPAAEDASLSALVRRIAELEAENAAIRSLLATMGQAAEGLGSC